MDKAVERAIECIWERYSEPLTLTEMAERAMLSRFYFARLFKDATGITPARFLSAVRIYQAKRLLLSTSMSITDISSAVGYNSLGSFTNYFTGSVGLPPSRFRRMGRSGEFGLPRGLPNPRAAYGAVAGTISLPDGYGNGRVYLGAFTTPIVQRMPATAVIVDIPAGRPSCYHLPQVPEGTWYLHAVGVADGLGPEPWAQRTSLTGTHDQVEVTGNSVTSAAVRLRHPRPTDPPVLLALPYLEPLPGDPAPVSACAAVTPRPARTARPALPRRLLPAPEPLGE